MRSLLFTALFVVLFVGTSACFGQVGGGQASANYAVLANDVRIKPIENNGVYDEMQLRSQHRAYLHLCSTVASITPTKTFETWIGQMPQSGQAATWNLVMDARVYGDLENPASTAGMLFQQISTNSPVRLFEDQGGVQYRYVDLDKSPLRVYSKEGAPAGDPDSTWDVEHSFNSAFATSPALNKGQQLDTEFEQTDPTEASFKAIIEVNYQTPVPELYSADETEYGLDVLFRYKISRQIGAGSPYVELGYRNVHDYRKGIFKIECSVEDEVPNTLVQYHIEREYKLPAGNWTDDSGTGSSKFFEVAWPGNCQGTGGI